MVPKDITVTPETLKGVPCFAAMGRSITGAAFTLA